MSSLERKDSSKPLKSTDSSQYSTIRVSMESEQSKPSQENSVEHSNCLKQHKGLVVFSSLWRRLWPFPYFLAC